MHQLIEVWYVCMIEKYRLHTICTYVHYVHVQTRTLVDRGHKFGLTQSTDSFAIGQIFGANCSHWSAARVKVRLKNQRDSRGLTVCSLYS